MNKLNFETGYKEYCINDDESKIIHINTTDFAILDRIKKAMSNIDSISKEYENVEPKNDEDTNILFVSADKKIKEQIDYIFNSDVSSVVFGNTSCMSLTGGQPIFMNFLNAIIPIIHFDIEKEINNQNKKVAKYTSQVK